MTQVYNHKTIKWQLDQNDKYDFEKCHVTPNNIRKVHDNLNPIPLWGDGTEVRDIIHVDDMVSGFASHKRKLILTISTMYVMVKVIL